jgi:monoamine oxidase
MSRFTRRAFLRNGLLGAAGLAVAASDRVPFSAWRIASAQRPRRVVVVGGGLAGLVAAYELVEAGHDVVVLEAQLRPGGRVYTLRDPFADGLHAEAGAARIPDIHDLTRGYAARFGLPLVPFQPDQPRRVYVRGRRFSESDTSAIEAALGFDARERRAGRDRLLGDLLSNALPRIGDWQSPGWPDAALRDLDRLTAAEYVRRRGASRALVQALDLGLGLLDEASMLEALRSLASEADVRRLDTIEGGNDRLPAAFATQLGPRIRYGSPVVRLEQDERAVRAIVEQGGTRVTVEGEYLICALPFTLLRRIDVAPRFTPDKQRAIERLHYAAVSRVYLQSAARYWTAAGESGFAITDHPMEVFDATYGQPGTRGILMAYTRGPLAARVASMPSAARITWGLQELGKVYPGLNTHFEGGISWCWSEAPWARGAFALHTPGQLTSLYPVGTRPEGRIHFAGEHLSPWPGWMQGALASGLRVAREVAARG